MKINLKFKGNEEFIGTNENGNSTVADMRSNEVRQYQTPTEMLLSAVGACASVEIVSMIKKRRKTFIDLAGEISGNRRDEHPRGFTDIHLKYFITSPDLTEEEAERIVTLATTKYCSVAGSLNAKQTHSFEIIRP